MRDYIIGWEVRETKCTAYETVRAFWDLVESSICLSTRTEGLEEIK